MKRKKGWNGQNKTWCLLLIFVVVESSVCLLLLQCISPGILVMFEVSKQSCKVLERSSRDNTNFFSCRQCVYVKTQKSKIVCACVSVRVRTRARTCVCVCARAWILLSYTYRHYFNLIQLNKIKVVYFIIIK